MPPCAQALDAPEPSEAAERIVTGPLSLSAVKSPARPAPTISTPPELMTLSALGVRMAQCTAGFGLPTASMRSTAARARAAMAGSTLTSCVIVCSERRILSKRDALHVRAEIAGAQEFDVANVGRNVVGHRAFGQHDDARRALLDHVVDHGGGRAGEIAFGDDVGGAFGMGEHDRAGMVGAEAADVLGREAFVHLAAAVPGDDLDLRLVGDVLGQELVGDEDDRVDAAFGGDRFDHRDRVRRRAADVAFGFHVGRGVHVGDDGQVRVFLLQQAHVGAGDGGGERAAGFEIGDQHRLVGRQDLRRLGHEVDAGLDDDLRVGLGRFARELERVADEIGDAVEDFGRLIIVREDDGAALFLQAVDLGDHRREVRPFDFGNDVRHFRVEFARGRGHLGRVSQLRLERWFRHRTLIMLNLSIYMVSKTAAPRPPDGEMLRLSIRRSQARVGNDGALPCSITDR